MTNVTFPSGNAYTDATAETSAADLTAANARLLADPTIDDKPALWPILVGTTTVVGGVIVVVEAE
jgi:hypothetical protein